MLTYLSYVQAGFLSPWKFKQDEVTKRLYSLHISTHHDVENAHTAGVNTMALETVEHRYLLSGCSDGSIYIHDLNNFTGQPHYSAKCICNVKKNDAGGHHYSVECASWYGEDNALFITSGTDKNLLIWDANYMKSVETFRLKGRIFHHHCSPIKSSNPVVAVASSVNHVELIDLRTGSAVHELRGHNSSILACQWSPRDQHLLASGGLDNQILLWDTRSSQSCLRSLDQQNAQAAHPRAHAGYVNGLRFTADGLLLVSSGTDNRLRLWETLNGNHQMINYGKVKNDVKKHVQFEVPNGSKPELIFVPSEGNILVLEVFSGRRVAKLHGHFNNVNCCLYREAYQELYSGGNDWNVLVWTADEPVAEAKIKPDNIRKPKITTRVSTVDSWSSASASDSDDNS